MNTHKIIGLTKCAERYLCVDDYEYLNDCIGSEIKRSDDKVSIDGSHLFIMPDGETCHEDFLVIEPIQ